MPRRYVVTLVHGNMIVDGTITTNKLANQAVTTDKLANQAVTRAKASPEILKNPFIPIGQPYTNFPGNQFYLFYNPLLGSQTESPAARVAEPLTINELHVVLSLNQGASACNVFIQVNGVNSDKKVTIPAGTTGVFSETATPLNLNANDEIRLFRTATTGTGYVTIAGVYLKT
jgi:hypothetical protein